MLFCLAAAQGLVAAEIQPYTTWNDYGGSADSMQYSALTRINRTNVNRLEPAWFYPVPGRSLRLVFNPLIVDRTMYVLGPGRAIVALDAATGNELWSHTDSGGASERGISYWESKDRSDRRLIFAARGALRQVNALTGQAIMSFGEEGRVNMRVGEPRPLGGPSGTPVRIFENLIITGSNTGEGYGSPPGDLRAYDVFTGELVWTFRTIPHPGDYGYETWPTNAWKYAGGANTWGEITVDNKHGIVFFPTGSPTFDFYGSDRVGDNLFGNCLIALDARTGKRLWHFQTVHHDTWDYDLTAGPKLLTVRHNGQQVDIVAQAGKTGFLYVFERVTGRPLWPIVERRVPKSEIPGEVSSPTQPIPTKPPPFARQSFSVDEINPHLDPAEQKELREALLKAANEGVFTPSSHRRYSVQMPGAWGGANWGATAADPATGMLYVRSLEQPSYRIMSARAPRRSRGGEGTNDHPGLPLYMQYCSSCHGPGQAPMRSPRVVGLESFRNQIRQGREQMPAFAEDVLSPENLEILEAYLISLGTRDSSSADDRDEDRAMDAPLRLPAPPDRYSGPPIRYSGNAFAAGWYTRDGLPAIGPPWTQLVAYDLNEGTIKWQVPDGTMPGLADQGITNTGSFRPRNGPVVTAGGLVIAASSSDQTLRAYDKENGKLLWEHRLEANPEGIPAVYEVDGRQYIAFAAGAGVGSGPTTFVRQQGKIEAQGYHVFALPEKASTSKE